MTTLKTWMKRTLVLSAVGVGAFAVGAPKAEAGTIASNFTVSTTVQQACTVLTTPNLTFPTYVSGTVTADTASTTFVVTCPGATAAIPDLVTFTLVTASGPATFQMAGTPSGTLNYGLYQDAAYSVPYVPGTAGNVVSITSGAGQNYSLYGQIAAGLTPTAGTYSQSVTATLTY